MSQEFQTLFVPEGASVGVAVRVVGGGAKELLIELGGGEVAQGVVKCEIDNLRLLVALVQFLLVKLGLVAAAEAVRQFALGYFTFCSFLAGLGRKFEYLRVLFEDLLTWEWICPIKVATRKIRDPTWLRAMTSKTV